MIGNWTRTKLVHTSCVPWEAVSQISFLWGQHELLRGPSCTALPSYQHQCPSWGIHWSEPGISLAHPRPKSKKKKGTQVEMTLTTITCIWKRNLNQILKPYPHVGSNMSTIYVLAVNLSIKLLAVLWKSSKPLLTVRDIQATIQSPLQFTKLMRSTNMTWRLDKLYQIRLLIN